MQQWSSHGDSGPGGSVSKMTVWMRDREHEWHEVDLEVKYALLDAGEAEKTLFGKVACRALGLLQT